MFSKKAIAFAAGISTASAAVYQGFNYASSTDFPTELALAKDLAGTNGAFASARLYTTIDATNANLPTSAIPAAINLDVTLLLGVWASAGQPTIDNEITAIKNAIAMYGTDFTSRVVGISVGSEDLYRISPTGIINKSGAGANPDDLVSYIGQIRAAIAGTGLAGVPVGHVDTWTAWVNGSNDAVISACDFLGMDAYPYFQTTQDNTIQAGADLFFSAYDQTVAASMGKPVWVTETGWPASGPTAGVAVPSIMNAQTYWDAVACKLLGTTNTWWYTLNDAGAAPSFGVTTGSTTPLYNLSCAANPTSSTSSSSSSTASSTSSVGVSSSTSVTASSTVSGSSSMSGSTTALSSTAVVSSTGNPSGASLTSLESTASPSNVIFTVTSSAVPSQVGGGSPGDTTRISSDSSVAVLSSASPSLYSSILSSAASQTSVAFVGASATMSTATLSTATLSTSAGTSMAVGTSASGSASASASGSASVSAVASGTTTATGSLATYTGGASSLQSTGGIIAAIFVLIAAM